VKLNLGCGFNRIEGFVNVDKSDVCQPDLVMDLEVTPWNVGTSEVDEVVFNHSLEHLGQQADVFLRIIQELYRVCKPGAKIHINVPHPRHDNFIGDPTHVRVVTPQMFTLFSKRENLHWKETGAANSPLALYLGVDFEVTQEERVLEQKYLTMLQTGQVSPEDLEEMVKELNNVVSEYRITLEVIK
jgi:hypothetical protein